MLRRMLPSLPVFGLFAALCMALTFASNTPASAYSLARCTSVQVVSHRGLKARRITENTLRAYQNAYNRGARTIETDIQLTADKQWAVMHDMTINRTTPGTGLVASKTLAQLKYYKTNDGIKGGIPALYQALYWLKTHPTVRMQLEIKSYTADDAALKHISTLADQYGVKNRVTVISFGKTVLSKIRLLDPALSTGLLTNVQVSPATAAAYGRTIFISKGTASAAYIAGMHQAGIRVITWTVNSKAQWRQMVTRGADGITTDSPPALNKFCRRR